MPAADMTSTSTLAFRPASTALSAPPGPVTNFSNVLATLPPIGDVMPPLALRKGIWELPHEDDEASHFVWAGLGVQDPAQRSVYFATGVTKLDREVQEMRSGVEETNEDVISNHAQELVEDGLVRLIKEHGTPELKAGLMDLEQEIKEEEERINNLWKEKKKGTKLPDLDPDAL
ncbi:hypothetical protein NEMBOFW57_006846 [Staphylotrichum longicolle]|uniref:Uncharacterized protein n=1 Tax=Staphylotrichum longicolle TaxID=669026 RepID=A0AAD4ETQ6_9PEZI|nr:hypothetical protein NEMBOFW57_006846 [Staphylotrichum longicolle]